jgi:hypothetical protein
VVSGDGDMENDVKSHHQLLCLQPKRSHPV